MKIQSCIRLLRTWVEPCLANHLRFSARRFSNEFFFGNKEVPIVTHSDFRLKNFHINFGHFHCMHLEEGNKPALQILTVRQKISTIKLQTIYTTEEIYGTTQTI
jgi:hypothetical protein